MKRSILACLAAAALVAAGAAGSDHTPTVDLAVLARQTASPLTEPLTMTRFMETEAVASLLLPAASLLPAAQTVPLSAMKAPAAPSRSSAAELNALVARFQATKGPYYDKAGYSGNHYSYTVAELKMLAVVIYLEARGQPYREKLAVANVVMNRVLSPGYPGSTIRAVVTSPNQFCYKASVRPDAECLRAARDVLDREVWVVPQSIYFFRATRSHSDWGRHDYWGHVGATAFYRGSYAGRSNASSVPPELYSRVYKWPQYGCKPEARVRRLQRMLDALGYRATADGWFGADTRAALLRFQKDQRLTADGVAGPATLRALIRRYGIQRCAAMK